MEQHPIPQDITGFKFKLVGDMTLQQFGYLAGGAILAYLSFVSKFPFLLKWPLAFLFGFGGFALAFIPVEERPLDRWIISFIKAIYSPTQYLWQKKEKLPEFFETSYLSAVKNPSAIISAYNGDRIKLEEYLKTLPKTPTSNLDLTEQAFLQSLNFPAADIKQAVPLSKTSAYQLPPLTVKTKPTPPETPAPVKEIKKEAPTQNTGFTIISGRIIKTEPPKKTPPYSNKYTITPPPQKSPTDTLETLKYQNQILAKQATSLKEDLGKLKEGSVFTVKDLNKLKDYAKRLSEVENQRNKAQEELIKLRQQLQDERTTGIKPIMEEIQIKETPRVKFIPDRQAKRSGLPNTPQTPNIISGLVVNQKGEILPGTIIVIKDIYDNPVRAMKTNKVGQFSISTPLTNGVYNLELEKEGYEFDIIEIEAKGEVIPPVEIKAK